MEVKKILLNCFVGSLGLGAVLAILIFLIGKFGEIELDLLFTSMTIGLYSLFGLCCGILYDKTRYKSFSLIGLSLCVIAALYTIGVIWEIIAFDDVIKWSVIVFIISASVAHISLLLLVETRKFGLTYLRGATICLSILVAALLIFLLLRDLENIDNLFYRLLGILTVLDMCGTIITPIYARVGVV